MGYETPCSVTGTGYMQAKRMHLKAYAQIGISERGKAAAHECIHTMRRLLRKSFSDDISSIHAAESGATVPMKSVKADGGIGTSRQMYKRSM